LENKLSNEDLVSEVKTLLGKGTRFKGVLTFEGIVRIDGDLEGEVISKDTLIVGEEASISADIKVGTIVINGSVTGNIVADNKIEIKERGVVSGNVKTPSIVIDDGGLIDGRCDMVKKKEKSKTSPPKVIVSAKEEEKTDSAAE
jgi:cytoskeletal protein CcmA (bactofilin family)